MQFPEQLQVQDFSKYLFPSRKGADTPLTRQSLWRIIHEAGMAVGLKEIGPHSMRKTFGYFLYKQGTKQRSLRQAAQPFFATGDLTLYWDRPGR